MFQKNGLFKRLFESFLIVAIATTTAAAVQPSCRSDQFRCNDGHCIENDQRCDRRTDCRGGEDENNCPPIDVGSGSFCQFNQFHCGGGICIMDYKRCNGYVDCSNGVDEENCPPQPTEPSCSSNQFQCNDGNCIDSSYRCDNIPDCPDRSDELDCAAESCGNGEIKCLDGSCIRGQKCDSIFDCVDGSDENDCASCNINEFKCDDSRCIPEEYRCNDRSDCSDGSDERDCVLHCPGDNFRCGDGLCLDARRRCDGYPDCRDQSDENGCPGVGSQNTTNIPTTCASDDFQCEDKTCISSSFRCDTFEDCPDGSDEKDCKQVQCGPDSFDCGDGTCIPLSQKCDSRPDCATGLDESSCGGRKCGAHEHTCNDGSCIQSFLVCDGTPHCRDGSDERECGCGPEEFTCNSGACIPSYLRCNRRPDCSDSSDEYNCPTDAPVTEPEPPRPTQPPPVSVNCPWGQQPCRSGNQCLPYAAFCDGRIDCNDLSDETNCPGTTGGLNIKTYPNEQSIKESVYKLGREVVFQCRDEGPLRAKVQWLRGNGLPLPTGSKDHNGRLEIPNIQLEHAGSYICAAIGYPPSTPGAQVHVYLTVEPLTLPPTRPPSACGLQEATCANGDCISKQAICDGKYDCTDGSDETRCSAHGCEPNEYRCANKQCILKTWRCDGDVDCADGDDEANCATNPPGSSCQYSEFECHSGNQCIPKGYHCDQQSDCVDGSDEVGCSKVVIAKPPPPMVHLHVGEVFIVSCTAVGVPTPEILWRLNWHHIPEKCTTTSVNGVGTLTCPDIQLKDQGAYSCEAINIGGSIIATPDAVLVVEGGPSVCPRGTFNEEARTTDDCISCFCFGATADCRSADLFTYQLQPPFDSHKYVGVQLNNYAGVSNILRSDIYRGTQPELTPVGRNGVRAKLASPYAQSSQPNVTPYFAMPENYQGNQLKSYGGYLKYNLHFEGYGAPLNDPEVILKGNGYTLLYLGKPHNPGFDEQVTVRFFVGDWVKRTETAPEALATREEIMMILENVENLLIKLQYVEGHLDTTISNVEMDSAAVRNTGLGQATFVEECTCPVGYSGLSCEQCAPGYSRHRAGPWLGQCYKEPEVCQPGTYGDPARGIPCQTCPCPLTNPSNQFGRTCHLGPDGEVTCECPPGYTGRRCQQCSAGYTGNPLIPGDSCKPGGSNCNSEGAASSLEDPSGRCICKQNTDGPTCDQCKPNTFHLSSENQFGCIACFCMGITQQCTSSNWYRSSISTSFANSISDFQLIESSKKEVPISRGIRLDQNAREITYSDFSNQNQDVYYWALPSRYLGDKVSSYGGNLRYSLRYVPMPGGQSSKNSAPDVELISDNHINLLYFGRDYPQPNLNESFTVPLLEQYWQRGDGQKADREHLLMTLADLKAILIKATYTTNTREAGLISVSLDTADERNTGRERASAVEQCQCPQGYKGLSCEDCNVGYTRAPEGLYLGLCEVCSCNGHSTECDPDTGECSNCRDNTAGQYCDECRPGYTPDPITGQCKSQDQVCECDPKGSLSSHCIGGVCQCKTNVEGNNCDRCRKSTFGLNASDPEGCQECFCSGITDQCGESNLYIEQIPSPILDQNNHGYSLTDQNQQSRITTDFVLSLAENKIGYAFKPGSTERWYWSLPSDFTGNKVKSYGGKLEFTQIYSAYIPDHVPDQDLIITGNGVTIYWTNPQMLQPDRNNKISVTLSPNANWQRLDYRQGPRPASRDDILIALANINAILIRATLSSNTLTSYISDISLDTAVEQYTGKPKAADVESCKCPPGYRGTSCELCVAGYYRDINDLQTGPLGSCSRCPCQGNEESCHLGFDNRVVCNCLPGYWGSSCQNIGTTENPTTTTTESTQPPPLIYVTIDPPSIKIVEVGTDLRLRCTASSVGQNIPITISWSKDGGYLSPDRAIDDGRGILVITDIRVSDAGNYICQATDGYIVVSQHTTVNVGGGNPPERPTCTVSPPSIQVDEGQVIEIYYTITGNPLPEVQWTRVGGLPFNPQHSFGNGVFRIPYALITDAGEYELIVTNIAGSHQSTVYIGVNEIAGPQMVVKIKPSQVHSKNGDTFILVCEAPVPLRNIVWSRTNRQPIPYNSNQTPDNSMLTVYDAKPEDSGIYVCTVTSYTGTSGSGNASVTISSTQVETFPTVVTKPKSQTVSQGSTTEIHCEATGSPAPTIKWTKIGDPFPPHVQQVGPVLRLQNVQIRDRGVYICVASNNAGIAQDSSIIEVERLEVPIVEIQPHKALTVISGGSIVMQCRVIAGIPQPEVSWSRPNGAPLSSNIEQHAAGVLRFMKVSLEEAGQYTCTASNKAGKTTAVGQIEVHTVPILTVSPHSGTISVRLGQALRLECKASGIPQPTVQWSKHIADYPNAVQYSETFADTRARVLQNVAVYEITHVTASDQGYYICQGTNSAGTSEERVSIIVESVPERGDITGEDGSSGGNENKTPYPPYLSPRPPFRDNEHVPSHTDKTFTAPVGTRAELRCQTNPQGSADPLYVNWVRGDNSSLPVNSIMNNGILYIENVQPSDAGEYKCLGIHSSGAIVFSFSAHLMVVSPPRITLEPSRQTVRPGDDAHVLCHATGDQPISITWSAMNRNLPQSALARDGQLQFHGIQVTDAGIYKCTAINPAGEADAVAEVIVQDGEGGGPTITAEGREQTAVVGASLMLHCIVRGSGNDHAQPTVRWFREHLAMPPNSDISGEYVRIVNIQQSDAGRYFCEVERPSGTSSDFIDVKVNTYNQEFETTTTAEPFPIEPVESSELDIQLSSPVCYIGNTVDLYCRSNEPGVITSWSKVADRFADNIQTSGGTLRITTARRDNTGLYRCEARGLYGVYHKDYTLEVIDPSLDDVQGEQPIETKTAAQGSTIIMECRTELGQPVSYKWSKSGGVLPRDVSKYSRTIQINEVKEGDAGTYICTASNGRTSIDIPTILLVTGIVPYFAQAPTSYVALPTLPDAYIQFTFEISFRPEVSNGLFLYNGHRKSAAKADFISLALVKGIPEFRFNLGQSVTVVVADKPVELGKWHTVKVSRNRKRVTMYVDGKGPFVGVADGKFLGLDLTEHLYLGGVPNFKEISPDVQATNGFVGCISRLKIGHAFKDILREAIMKDGITTCETCSENPCHNQGVCQEALTKEGYMCICPLGFSGPTCSKQGGESCTPNLCGVGRCIDTEESFNCLCPMGRAGRHCEQEIEIYEPAFSRDAYIAYPAPKPQRRLKVSLKFKPKDLNDGILLYCSENDEGHGNFVSLAIKDGHVEFRFDIGTEPIVVRSEKLVRPGEWLAVTASKFLNEGRLLVNGDAPITQRITRNHKALELHTPLYIGGIDKNRINVNSAVGVQDGFSGCISEINVSGLDLNIIQSVTDSANIRDCNNANAQDLNENSNEILPPYENEFTSLPFDNRLTGCSSSPCRNDGHCYPLSSTEYKCNCVHGYLGTNCEIAPELCSHLQPCQNGGTCNGTTSVYTCDCPIGFTGTNCEQRADVRNEVNFKGDSYVELSNSLLSHKNNSENEVIAFELSTNSSAGLVFWYGQKPSEEGQGQDYISLAVVDGYLEYSFELGSGPAIIYNNQVRVNDGQRHRVILKRQSRWGSIEVDNDYTTEGYSDGKAFQINAHGNIYLGGTPNNSRMTGGRYVNGFEGCIHGFELQDSRMLDIGVKAIYGVNVKPCSSSSEKSSMYGSIIDDDLI